MSSSAMVPLHWMRTVGRPAMVVAATLRLPECRDLLSIGEILIATGAVSSNGQRHRWPVVLYRFAYPSAALPFALDSHEDHTRLP